MSLHKLTAGTGYTYLTRQVAAHDRTPGPRTSLASYYSEKGETPGRWVGSGVAGIDGLSVGDEVTALQMRALFGARVCTRWQSSVGSGWRGLACRIGTSKR